MSETRTKFVSGDGIELYLDREIAIQSGTVKRILDNNNGQFAESIANEISFPEIRQVKSIQKPTFITFFVHSGKILEIVCKYLVYKWRYSDGDVFRQIPDFVFDPEIALELMMAADYLDC
ncbi:hypothetical protein BB559_003439 [Furculomyces boomerangus]|uniref:Elongin-C n=2 Tax=Harpellales TaxID=61421 RepID=A0A2T9YL79_9FUNG|nr:hypothetical protein BB559_006354 [Furculomyces boomerangus]PVU93096.1 hypothetical protein BB559_003439 [Furculomyces boomerangus]PWA03676.1 hypothetical protein BB558_000186 [Smittium angustum]